MLKHLQFHVSLVKGVITHRGRWIFCTRSQGPPNRIRRHVVLRVYLEIKQISCHLVIAQSFHEKNVPQAVESFGKFFRRGATFLSAPRTSFTQKLETIPPGGWSVMSRKEKLGGWNADEFNPIDTRKKCQIYRRGLSRIYGYIGWLGYKAEGGMVPRTRDTQNQSLTDG